MSVFSEVERKDLPEVSSRVENDITLLAIGEEDAPLYKGGQSFIPR